MIKYTSGLRDGLKLICLMEANINKIFTTQIWKKCMVGIKEGNNYVEKNGDYQSR